MAAETIEIHVSDSTRITFTSSSSGLIVTVKSPDQRKLGEWTIRGSVTIPKAAVIALQTLFNKTKG